MKNKDIFNLVNTLRLSGVTNMVDLPVVRTIVEQMGRPR
jgi:hypothetical protein